MMPAAHADQIISGYLSRLEVAVRALPGGRGAELIDVFREHIAEARAHLVNESDADLLNILDRLGDPADIVADERARLAVATPAPVDSRNLVDVLAIVALLVVWPVGVVLLWISEAWSTRDKLIGTLLPPGGYLGVITIEVLLRGAPGFLAGCTSSTSNSASSDGIVGSATSGTTCPSPAVIAVVDAGHVLLTLLAVILVFMPILTAIYLGIRLRRTGARTTGNAVAGRA